MKKHDVKMTLQEQIIAACTMLHAVIIAIQFRSDVDMLFAWLVPSLVPHGE
jgi:hypothetical protein